MINPTPYFSAPVYSGKITTSTTSARFDKASNHSPDTNPNTGKKYDLPTKVNFPAMVRFINQDATDKVYLSSDTAAASTSFHTMLGVASGTNPTYMIDMSMDYAMFQSLTVIASANTPAVRIIVFA